jgi:prolipoprotein diacylglyceryltransferase
VEPDSPAFRSGVKPGDVIVAVDGRPVDDYYDLVRALTDEWPRGKQRVSFTVRRDSAEEVIGPYVPRTIGLNPTQIYESISMLLLFTVLVFLYPVRRFDGQVLAVLMLGYAVHRYCNELLRHDTPTYFLGLTVSQEISILIFAGGVIIWLLRRHSPLAPCDEPAVEPGHA